VESLQPGWVLCLFHPEVWLWTHFWKESHNSVAIGEVGFLVLPFLFYAFSDVRVRPSRRKQHWLVSISAGPWVALIVGLVLRKQIDSHAPFSEQLICFRTLASTIGVFLFLHSRSLLYSIPVSPRRVTAPHPFLVCLASARSADMLFFVCANRSSYSCVD